MTRTGRPPKPVADLRCVTFRIKLTVAERADLQRRAEDEGETPTQFVRRRVFSK